MKLTIIMQAINPRFTSFISSKNFNV
uniref:Uncharacterized protein n=1 Tax=Rhizophora mucronata TaxID=61149 RepID=A0A2P2PGC4_RHIMU